MSKEIFRDLELKKSLLMNQGSHLNESFRSKKDLLDNKLIQYKLNGDIKKVMSLTKKGDKNE